MFHEDEGGWDEDLSLPSWNTSTRTGTTSTDGRHHGRMTYVFFDRDSARIQRVESDTGLHAQIAIPHRLMVLCIRGDRHHRPTLFKELDR